MTNEVSRLLEEKIASFKPGSLIKGTVVRLTNDEVIIDIGYKSEGTTPREEFKGQKDNVKEGMEVQIVVESLDPDSNGLIPLSKEKADIILNWENVERIFNEEKPIEGIIFKRVKGGFRVDIGVTAFLPSSQTDLKPITNPSEYIGMKSFFK